MFVPLSQNFNKKFCTKFNLAKSIKKSTLFVSSPTLSLCLYSKILEQSVYKKANRFKRRKETVIDVVKQLATQSQKQCRVSSRAQCSTLDTVYWAVRDTRECVCIIHRCTLLLYVGL